MRCPSCGLQIDQPNTDRCPRCGYQLAYSSGQQGQADSSAGGSSYSPQGGEPGATSGYPPQAPANPYGAYGSGTPGTYGGYAPPSGYGGQPQSPYGQQGQYGSYAPPSGYGQPAPPSGFGQPQGQYGQAAPPSYPLSQGYPPAGYPQQPYAPPPKKSRTGLVVGIIVAVVVVLAACTGATIFAVNSLGKTPTTATGPGANTNQTPGAVASPTPSETVIYGNTFSSDATGWIQTPGECTLQSDGYHISSAYICYAPIGEQSDVSVTVNVQQVSGPTTYGYGIVFRRVSTGNFYDFMIDSNGKWVADKCVNSNCTALVDFTANPAITGGLHTSNTMKVVITGSHFDFFVNGTKVGQADDATFASGKVGLEGNQSVDCVFTDFVVSRPN